MKNKLFLISLILLAATVTAGITCLAQEQITITTYYPSPYGVYRIMRIFPSTLCTSSAVCSNEGEMCQSSTTHKLYVCSGSPLTWKEPGYWAPQTTNPNNIYNTNTGNVGIGLGSSTAPTQRLDVNGNINVRSSQVRMYNSANHYYGDGSNLAARMSGNFYVQNQAGSGYRYIYAADLYLAAPIYGVARWASQPPSSCIRKFFSSSSGTQTCPAGYNIPMAPLNPVQTSGVFLCCAYT